MLELVVWLAEVLDWLEELEGAVLELLVWLAELEAMVLELLD